MCPKCDMCPNVPCAPNVSCVPSVPKAPCVPNFPRVPYVPCVPNVLCVPNVPCVPNIPWVSNVPWVLCVPNSPCVLNVSSVPKNKALQIVTDNIFAMAIYSLSTFMLQKGRHLQFSFTKTSTLLVMCSHQSHPETRFEIQTLHVYKDIVTLVDKCSQFHHNLTPRPLHTHTLTDPTIISIP